MQRVRHIIAPQVPRGSTLRIQTSQNYVSLCAWSGILSDAGSPVRKCSSLPLVIGEAGIFYQASRLCLSNQRGAQVLRCLDTPGQFGILDRNLAALTLPFGCPLSDGLRRARPKWGGGGAKVSLLKCTCSLVVMKGNQFVFFSQRAPHIGTLWV